MQTTATTFTDGFATTVTAEAFATFPQEFATIVTAEEFATTFTEEIGPLQKPELCEPADWSEEASAKRV